MYPVFDLSESVAQRPETLGSKEKSWIVPGTPNLPRRPHLFKVGRSNTGENWSEKVAGEFAKKLGLPTANYELAVVGDDRGVLSERFMPDAASFLPGNTLLARIIDGYDGSKRFKQIEYTIPAVFNVLSRIRGLLAPFELQGQGVSVRDVFTGYLVFDALIGNTDRHHENWGLVLTFESGAPVLSLAPTFDHASSLGRELSDARRQACLTTRDGRATVEAYSDRARTAFFDVDGRALTTRSMLELLRQLSPDACRSWCARFAAEPQNTFTDILAEVPPDWMSETAATFATKLVLTNQGKLGDFANG